VFRARFAFSTAFGGIELAASRLILAQQHFVLQARPSLNGLCHERGDAALRQFCLPVYRSQGNNHERNCSTAGFPVCSCDGRYGQLLLRAGLRLRDLSVRLQ
jgi:hypothetical protein